MKKSVFNLFVAVFTLLTANVFATPAPTDAFITLRAGTVISLQLNEEISAEEVEVGNTLDFFVRSNVTVNGKVVVAAGSIAEGMVTKVKKACNGECAQITITVDNVQAVDGQRIYLRGRPHKVKAQCCTDCYNFDSSATLPIGTKLSARIQNDVNIDA